MIFLVQLYQQEEFFTIYESDKKASRNADGKDISSIWKSIGEKADAGYAADAFDNTMLASLSNKFKGIVENKPAFTEEQRTTAKRQDNNQALLNQKLSINFIIGNGPHKPIAGNNTEEGRALNRRTEVFFKAVE